jgi:hypothetical protein
LKSETNVETYKACGWVIAAGRRLRVKRHAESQFMRDNWLPNRIFKSFEDILDHCCAAWNKLIDQPWRILSIDLRDWPWRRTFLSNL